MAEYTHLTQVQSIEVDQHLMSQEGGFSIDQLMELAGLSVAGSVAAQYPLSAGNAKVLILCGPGNNGGDGLVAARHLKHFGYQPTLCYPKQGKNTDLFGRLVQQCKQLSLPFVAAQDIVAGGSAYQSLMDGQSYDLVIDAIFGFSFKGWRGAGRDAPYDMLLATLSSLTSIRTDHTPAVVAVDIPSGWNVESGPPGIVATDDDMNTPPEFFAATYMPQMLISLTAPKMCAKNLAVGTHHWLGGRFVPPSLVEKFDLKLPHYPSMDQCVKLN